MRDTSAISMAWPARSATTEPSICFPISARSPIRSRTLWRTNSSGKRNGGFSTSSRFSTMAFSIDAPRISPCCRMASASCRNPKVRPGAISFRSKTQRRVQHFVAVQHDGILHRRPPNQSLLSHGIGFMQKSESPRRRNLLQITAIRQPHAEALLANEWVRKVDRIRNRIGVCRIHGNEFIALAQFDLPHDPEISARFALSPNPRLLNHFYKRTGAAIQNGQLKIVQLDDGIVDADAGKRREQVLGSGDEHALLHQAGGVTDAGHVASAG